MTTHIAADDGAVLRELLARYFAAIDDHTLDRDVVEAVFCTDAQLVRPNGSTLSGPAQILAGQTRSFARFRATHHVSSDHIINTDTDLTTARIRANLIATHLWAHHDPAPPRPDPNALDHYFIAGGVLDVRAHRNPVGWRLHRLELRNTWRTGNGFDAMARTGAAGVPLDARSDQRSYSS